MSGVHDTAQLSTATSVHNGPRPLGGLDRTLPEASGRDRFLDLLRVVAISRVLVVHGAASTGSLWWPVPSWILPGMPIIFFVAGALAFPAVIRRGSQSFHRDRFRRLLFPYWGLLVTGLLVLVVGAILWSGDEWTLRPQRLLDAAIPVIQPRLAPALTDLGTHLWFASTFLVLLALTPALVRWHRWSPMTPVGACLAVFLVLNAVDRLWTPVAIEVLYVPMYGIFLCAGFGYADGSLLGLGRWTSLTRTRPWLWPAVATLVLTAAVIGGWTAYQRGTRDLSWDVVGHTFVAAGWLVVVLALRSPLQQLGERTASVLDRVTPRTLTLYLWSAPAGVLAWRLAERVDQPAGRIASYVIGTTALTAAALAVFGTLEDFAAGRKDTPRGRARRASPDPPEDGCWRDPTSGQSRQPDSPLSALDRETSSVISLRNG